MTCPRCKHENRPAAKFCDECGVRLSGTAASSDIQARLQNDDLRRALAEAAEQQAATAEILSVISRSPTDVRPVFETILERAATLCEAQLAHLWLHEGGEQFRLGAGYGSRLDHLQWLQQGLHRIGRPFFREIGPWRVGQILDVRDTEPYRRGEALWIRTADHEGMRTLLGVPLVKDGRLVGAIAIYRREVRSFTDAQVALVKTFADQAVIAIENVRLFNETREALERQKATSDILGIIARSPADIQPVLDAVAERAATLCESHDSQIWRRDGDRLLHAAHHGSIPVMPTDDFIIPVRGTITGRSVLEARTVQVHDVQIQAEDFPEGSELGRRLGYRTILSVPLMRDGVAVGAIALRRTEARSFTESQVALLQTFADQAVIAIENVRLFKELEQRNQELTEALEQQTGTSDILQVISGSPTDVQPVLEAVAESAARLTATIDVAVFLCGSNGLRLAAHHGPIPVRSIVPLIREEVTGRAVLDGQTVHVADLQSETVEYPRGSENARRLGLRTVLSVPLLREGGIALGTINLRRSEVRLFTERQVALLQTFADQAVIAIENVRLFTELQDKNKALTQAHAQVTEALDQQTATAEILRIISSSPSDAQPVFESIVRSAVRLCGARVSSVLLLIEETQHIVATHGLTSQWIEAARQRYPQPLQSDSASAVAMRERRVVHIPDVETDHRFPGARTLARTAGYRSLAFVPMLREGVAVGAISVAKDDPFSDSEITLLWSFSDQAVIAIENVRLFKELQASNRDLTTALDKQTATSDILRVISRSQTDINPVFDAIARSAVKLCGAFACRVFRVEDELLPAVGEAYGTPEAWAVFHGTHSEAVGHDSASATAVRERRVVQYADVPNDPDVPERYRERARARGYRALLCVPMMRDQVAIGTIAIARQEPVLFSEQQVQLIKTFADQAVIAIENVRLLTALQARTAESEEKSRQLEAASQHKSEFLANMSHELRTPLNAIIGFSEVLNERMFGELNEKQDEYLKDIHASGQHLLSLINDILDLSKIEAGRMELELSEFDLPATLDNALILVRERAGRRSIALDLRVDQGLEQIQADERKIRQVLLNLLSNAIKFTPEGGRIEVGAKPVKESIEVSVSDTGVGIAPEDQEAIFEEFKQVGTADKKVEGTGLGLALSRKFIELHGGRIWVKSQPGQGSTFTFTVPRSR